MENLKSPLPARTPIFLSHSVTRQQQQKVSPPKVTTFLIRRRPAKKEGIEREKTFMNHHVYGLVLIALSDRQQRRQRPDDIHERTFGFFV